MNSDSFFDSEFFQENKGLMSLLVTIGLAFLTIYYICKGLLSNSSNGNPIHGNIPQNQQALLIPKNAKRRISITANGILFQDLNSINVSNFYHFLDRLSDDFDLYILVLIAEKDEKKLINEKFEPIIEDNIIYKHRILFSSKLEGLCAMIRSIEPYAHIESQHYVVENLIRFVNEFWFLSKEKGIDEKRIEENVKTSSSFSNCSGITIQGLMNKIKYYKDLHSLAKGSWK